MKIIAHGIKNLSEAKTAIQAGADFVEIDVSKRFFFDKFTAQHNGLMGIFGIGTLLDRILIAEIKTRAFLDLKPVSPRNSFASKLAELLIKLKTKNTKICGHDWKMISKICLQNSAHPFYTLKNKRSLEKFKRQLHLLKKPAGFSVHYKLIDKKFMKEFRKKSVQVWVWTVNDLKEAKRLAELKVDGIITDNWQKIK